MSGYGTNFVESEAVLAAGQRDVSRVDELLADMLPNELADFESACELLVERIEHRARQQSEASRG